MSLIVGLATLFSMRWWLEPKPDWSIHFADKNYQYQPIVESQCGKWLLVVERKELKESAILILNTATGEEAYRLDDVAQVHDFWALEPSQQYPRFIDNVIWRFKRVAVDDGIRHELRRWDFSSKSDEEIIQTWTSPHGKPFEVTFAPDNGSTFLIQTVMPWELGLATLGTDGWTGLINLLGWSASKPANSYDPLFIDRSHLSENMPCSIPWIQTYALPTNKEQTLRQLARWTLPALRWTWPPAVGQNLEWIAFGDSVLPPGWKSTSRWAYPHRAGVQPQGVLLYDGHTGKQRALVIQPEFMKKLLSTEFIGNLLRFRITERMSSKVTFLYYDVKSGKQLQWPEGIKHPGSVGFSMNLIEMENQPQFLSSSWETNKYDFGVLDSIAFMKMKSDGISVHKDITLEKQQGEFRYVPTSMALLHQNVLICDGNSENYAVFSLLRNADNKPWHVRLWYYLVPTQAGKVLFYDLDSGSQLGELSNRAACKLKSNLRSPMLFTQSYATVSGMPVFTKSFEGWTLPVRLYSPWWYLGSGLVGALVTMLFFWYRKRAPSRDSRWLE